MRCMEREISSERDLPSVFQVETRPKTLRRQCRKYRKPGRRRICHLHATAPRLEHDTRIDLAATRQDGWF